MNTTAQVLAELRAYESRNVTYFAPDGSWPIVWERAQGNHVWDGAGRRYLDLTAAFGVAAAGHANPRVVAAGQLQMAKLLHAMGDVHPHALKAELARALSRITFERWAERDSRSQLSSLGVPPTAPDVARRVASSAGAPHPTGKVIFGNSGFEAVEAALKTALLATGRPGVLAFEGAYHGLGYGALNATHRAHFRSPFRRQLREFATFVPFPAKAGETETVLQTVRSQLRRRRMGAVLVEPVQGRAGIRVPPAGFLPGLRQVCAEHQTLLVLDEIYTGFGRTGRRFACEHGGVVPDLICLGKALTGGFPLSACVGRAELMDAAWPESTGEAIHTSTFLGHPVGCAMALAQIRELERRRLDQRSAAQGKVLLELLNAIRLPGALRLEARGLGLMAGLELRRRDGSPATAVALRAVTAMLRRGFVLLPEGEPSNVIGFTPPLTITTAQLERTVRALAAVLREVGEA